MKSKAELLEQAAVATTWRKSTKSGPISDNCVEVAGLDGGVAVRDSKGTGATQVYDVAEFRAFVDGAKAGEFDDLI